MTYIEHRNSHQPPTIRRYATFDLAISGVARSTHLPAAEIEPTLRAARAVRLGNDSWRIVTLAEMQRRAGFFARATQAMERGADIDPDDVP